MLWDNANDSCARHRHCYICLRLQGSGVARALGRSLGESDGSHTSAESFRPFVHELCRGNSNASALAAAPALYTLPLCSLRAHHHTHHVPALLLVESVGEVFPASTCSRSHKRDSPGLEDHCTVTTVNPLTGRREGVSITTQKVSKLP